MVSGDGTVMIDAARVLTALRLILAHGSFSTTLEERSLWEQSVRWKHQMMLPSISETYQNAPFERHIGGGIWHSIKGES
jgi:predicted ATP-dependent endonuclease of OLD family